MYNGVFMEPIALYHLKMMPLLCLQLYVSPMKIGRNVDLTNIGL